MPSQAMKRLSGTRFWVCLLSVAGWSLAAGGCQDLAITNPNEPDRDRALAEPEDLESLIAGTFSVFFDVTHGEDHVTILYSAYGAEMTAVTSITSGIWQQGDFPRILLDNRPAIPSTSGQHGPRFMFAETSEISSSVHDGLRTLEALGGTLTGSSGEDLTARTRAFAKFMQGLAWGYMSMTHDKGIVIPETEPTQADAIKQAIESQVPSNELRVMALASLDEAISIAEGSSFVFPAVSTRRDFFGTRDGMTSAGLAELANTIAARVLVLSARTPLERAQTDWNRVLSYTSKGLTSDFEVALEPGFRNSLLYFQIQDDAPGCDECMRLDYFTVGLADVSGAYQTYISTPPRERERFDIVTPDRRITGATPQSPGAYARYLVHDNGFPSSRSPYRRSAYQWARHLHKGELSNTGTVTMASVDENNLLAAEAHIYLGSLGAAADLINITRTRAHTLPDGASYPGLPAVTVAGVPGTADCVPRTDGGLCGDLMVALRYERMLELMAYDGVRGYLDSRGFGLLVDDSWIEAPIPGNELEVLGLPTYTFGGVGGESSAVYAPVTLP